MSDRRSALLGRRPILDYDISEVNVMKLMSWNVNGIRAILKKDFPAIIEKENPDILLLGETKWSETEHNEFPYAPEGYHLYWTVSKVRKGYSGVAVYTKQEPLSVHYGLNNGEYDEEGRIITLEFPSFYYVGAYVPNAGDGLKRLSFREEYEDKMRDYLVYLNKKKPVIYTGDLNVAHEEIDLANPDTNHKNPGFTDEERGKMTSLLSSGFIDAYRYLYPNKVEYSWWSYRMNARERNVGWRIDLFIISESLKEKVKNSTIMCNYFGSDHCPIGLEIEL